MGIELALTCNRLGAIELLEETGIRFEMLGQPMILAVSHAQRPPRQRLSSNAAGFLILQPLLGHEIVGRWPTIRTDALLDERIAIWHSLNARLFYVRY